MLLKKSALEAIRDGKISVVFRTWKRPTVKTGGSLKTAVGVLAIDEVSVVDPRKLTSRDAKAAGLASLAELRECASGREGDLYRIRLHWAGVDPRVELRNDTDISPEDMARITKKLTNLDARSAHGAWTRRVLELIRDHPHTLAAELAQQSGYEKEWLKMNVRKLKNLGLTISHHPGYELSPRGHTVLRRLR